MSANDFFELLQRLHHELVDRSRLIDADGLQQHGHSHVGDARDLIVLAVGQVSARRVLHQCIEDLAEEGRQAVSLLLIARRIVRLGDLLERLACLTRNARCVQH